MTSRPSVAATLAAVMLLAAAAPNVAPPIAAASCSGWVSEVVPPPSIRVYRVATGAVETVDFRRYVKNVLSREWIGSWSAASLQAGAVAVKSYAWYQVLHWRGFTNSASECLDVRDDGYDQVYDPSAPTWSTAAAAVDSTWATRVLKDGRLFPTYYNAGRPGERCAANANGWRMYQWGTQACGLAGRAASAILAAYYYPGVTVAGGGPIGSPPATPIATQRPTPAPTPIPVTTSRPTPTATPRGSGPPRSSPTAAPVGTPRATLLPTPSRTAMPTPLPAPAVAPLPDQQLPGGGQLPLASAATPPAAPAPIPQASVVSAEPVAGVDAPPARTTEGSWPRGMSALHVLAGLDRIDRSSSVFGQILGDPGAPLDARLLAFRQLIGPAIERLLAAIAAHLGASGVIVHIP
ncbi:MAG: SpoIID/LytB domain-containing protein [Candidatus Limnocylindria bacterium]